MIVVLGLRLHMTKTVLLHTDHDEDALTTTAITATPLTTTATDRHTQTKSTMRQQTNDSAARPDSVGAAVLRTGASSNGQQRVAIVIMRGKSFAREGGKSEGSTEWARLLSNSSRIAALGRKGVTLAVVLCTQGEWGSTTRDA